MTPTWQTAVAELFAAPYWIEPERREQVAQEWNGCMVGYGIDLSDYASVRSYATTIYDHLASRSMPLTSDATQFWPPEALTTLAAWLAAGCPKAAADPVAPSLTTLPVAEPQPVPILRRDILDLSEDELAQYRAALERIGATDLGLDNPWQQLGNLHGDWCLHYQEAFLLWHRANLLLFEQLTGLPTPYWNFMSPDAPRDGQPGSGLPQAFKDLTYVHPETGEERPNPMRFAVAMGGQSKACRAGTPPPGADCRYVQRLPILYTEGDDQRQEREQYVAMLADFQQQVRAAFAWPVFSVPEGDPGYPWANLPDFKPPQPDSDYPNRTDFDGLLEQPHDNFHGWFGYDMADNACTGFDPVFWSLHANIDRVFEDWKRANPAAQFTATFPLRPFIGHLAQSIEPANPDIPRYTTIGDMARDSRALGYDYAPPAPPETARAQPTLHVTTAAAHRTAPGPRTYVLFPGTRCVHDSYAIDVFLNLPDPTPESKHDDDRAHYVGRITRLGMGTNDTRGRCGRRGVTRVLEATDVVQRLGDIGPDALEVSLLVTDLSTGRHLTPTEYAERPGFSAVLSRTDGTAVRPPDEPPPGHCCSG